MHSVNEILSSINKFAPKELAEAWDNNGLVVGRADAMVTRVLVALDCNMTTLQEATDRNCQVLLSHHPLIFGNIQQVNDTTVTGRAILYAIENGIACVNAHTCLDKTADGVNDRLAERLGLKNITTASDNLSEGYLRFGTVDEIKLQDFAQKVKETLQCGGVRFASSGKTVHKVAVGGGSCGSEIPVALACGCDTLVTADLKYNHFLDAAELGINLIDAGHYETESPICETLQSYLQNEFPELEVMISEKQGSPVSFL